MTKDNTYSENMLYTYLYPIMSLLDLTLCNSNEDVAVIMQGVLCQTPYVMWAVFSRYYCMCNTSDD